MMNRALLLVGLGALLFGLTGLALASPGGWPHQLSPLLQPKAAAQVAPPGDGQQSGQVREFKLAVGRVKWELAPGKVVDAYAFNGQIPGPEIRVTEGDTVRVTVTNTLSEPTTVHWHGVAVPAGMDGVPGLSQEPIPPGGSFTYEFVASSAGTRWYHSHFDEVAQQGGGLVGPLIVEPRKAAAFDREYTVVTGQWIESGGAPLQSPTTPPGTSGGPGGMGGMMGPGGMGGMMGGGSAQQPTPGPGPLPPGPMGPGGGMMGPGGMGGMMGGQGGMMGSGRSFIDTFSINGKTYPNTPPLLVRQGERVRLRLVNTGATETQTFALAGHKLTVTHTDGNPLAKPVETDAVLLGVGERVDVEFTADNPGRWQLRGLMPGQADRGLAIDVVYQGHESDAVQVPAPGTSLRYATYADFAGPPHPTPPDRTYDFTLSGGMMMGPNVWTMNGASYPNTTPIDVRQGERVRIRLFNMSMEDHPMHLHGHSFQVVAIGGRPVDGPIKDTITVRPMEEYEIEFVANNPGTWLFHCHNLQHMGGGLMTEVHYR